MVADGWAPVHGRPRILLQLEGAMLLAGAVTAYWLTAQNWWMIVDPEMTLAFFVLQGS